MLDAIVILYSVCMVLGIWGAVALFNSYRRLTDANNLLSPKPERAFMQTIQARLPTCP
jgi:hypothetical protein